MTETTTTEDERPTAGVVEQLARDDVERKRFLKMAGKRMGGGRRRNRTGRLHRRVW